MTDNASAPATDTKLPRFKLPKFNAPDVSRRGLLIGGGVGAGLIVAWALWPRQYRANMKAANGEHLFGPWLKIAEDGKVIVGIPQSEMGQGVYTHLAQAVAGELGADWRTVAVQPVMPSPLFSNDLLARKWASAFAPENIDAAQLPDDFVQVLSQRNAFVVTAGSSSLRQFEQPCRLAGAAARMLLAQTAADRWGVNWEACEEAGGFVTYEGKKLSFAELAAEAAEYDMPEMPPLRSAPVNVVPGGAAPRLDAPAKGDGSATFAGDIRLPDMLYASLRAGPIGDTRLKSLNRKGANGVEGLERVLKTDRWVAALATNWWAANRALDLMAPVFETRGALTNSDDMMAHLKSRFADGRGYIIAQTGDVEATKSADAGTRVYDAEYAISPAVHAPLETRSATASFADGRLQLWLAAQAPEAARQAAASAVGISADDVLLYPMMAGGSFGRNLDSEIAAQVAVLAKAAERPVQLVWSRPEDFMRDHYRPPAVVRMTASLGTASQIQGYSARIATPPAMRELAERLRGESVVDAVEATSGEYDALAVEGGFPPYAIPNISVAHFPADTQIPAGRWRGNAHNITAFTRECFIDELAAKAGVEPLTYRMRMLGGEARLARCLTRAGALGEWDGGADGSGKGIACHAMRGGYIAVVAAAQTDDDGISVRKITAVVDAGRIVNPDLAKQQIEGGIIFGIAQAVGASTAFDAGLPLARRLRDIDLPRLADIAEIEIEFLLSQEDPAGVGELGVPAVAPAIANALYSASGLRLRELPLLSRGL